MRQVRIMSIVTESLEQKSVSVPPRRAEFFGPTRRWLWLWVWIGLLLVVLAVTRIRISSRPVNPMTLTFGSDIESAEAVTLGPFLPLIAIVVISVTMFIGLRWWVPEKGTRTEICAWGCLCCVLSLAVFLIMCLAYISD